jgi:hypothetical protein
VDLGLDIVKVTGLTSDPPEKMLINVELMREGNQ